MKQLMTIGYGNQKPKDFLARLEDAGVSVVLDVRREQTRGWTPRYNAGDIGGMAMLMHGADILYISEYLLANDNDTLDGYKLWIETEWPASYVKLVSQSLKDRWSEDQVCLLCCERDAHKDGEVNCHRVYVADALVKLLGDEWSIIHL